MGWGKEEKNTSPYPLTSNGGGGLRGHEEQSKVCHQPHTICAKGTLVKGGEVLRVNKEGERKYPMKSR